MTKNKYSVQTSTHNYSFTTPLCEWKGVEALPSSVEAHLMMLANSLSIVMVGGDMEGVGGADLSCNSQR